MKSIIRFALLASLTVTTARWTFAAEQVKTTSLPVTSEKAFPKLKFDRPVVLTHAGDDSNRIFVVAQKGVIHSFADRQDVAATNIYLDMTKKVVYKDNENEEGLLGFAFHPKYKSNGEFFVYYTSTVAPHTSVISRMRVSKSDPNRADPTFEEEIMRIKQPFWNHNGGTIVFGPDGYLYVGLGDGGAANDPDENGQNLSTLLGSILRIDVDRKDKGRAYAIPKDNPFVGRGKARGEIWAYGLRNIWRMSFDRKTGKLWAGDVGQNLWEEINIIVRGGNYGWNLREARHPFGPKGVGPNKKMIDPVWEYHHSVGKSITGGHVYRGKRLPQLSGLYLYADYVTGKLWGLRYDASTGKATGNYELGGPALPVMSYGEDEKGEVVFTCEDGYIYRFKPSAK